MLEYCANNNNNNKLHIPAQRPFWQLLLVQSGLAAQVPGTLFAFLVLKK